MDTQLQSGVYKHVSGLLVLVLGAARHSETEEKLVAYIPLGVKEGPRITVRPYKMFFERFVYVGETVPDNLAKQYVPLSKK